MTLLALDASSQEYSIALYPSAPNSSNTAHYDKVSAAIHPVRDVYILSMVDKLLKRNQIELKQCAAIAFSAGPGAFTGLRTACALTQGLAFGAHLPVIPINTLLSCSENARFTIQQELLSPKTFSVISVIDARMQQIYWAQHRWNGITQEWHTEHAATLAEPEALIAPTAPFYLAGNALNLYAKHFRPLIFKALACVHSIGDAVAIARLALPLYQKKMVLSPEEALPIYIRNKIALTSAERAHLYSKDFKL